MILLPGALGAGYGKGSREAVVVSLVASLTAGSLGMLISMVVPVSPSGATGVSMLLIYAVASLYRRQ